MVIAYLIVGIVLAGIAIGIIEPNQYDIWPLGTVVALFWPLALCVVAIMGISYLTNKVKLKFFPF